MCLRPRTMPSSNARPPTPLALTTPTYSSSASVRREWLGEGWGQVLGSLAKFLVDQSQEVFLIDETVMLRQKHIPYLQTNKSSISRYTKRSFYKHSSCQAVVAHASCQHSRGRGRQADLCEFQDSHATEKLSRKRQNKLSQNKKQRLPSQLPQKQKQK